jgi:hypothetical protein
VTRNDVRAVSAGVRLALRVHVCRLVPASHVNWLADSTVERLAFFLLLLPVVLGEAADTLHR